MIALQLHLRFPLTGLMIFYLIYFPWSAQVAFEGNEQDFAAAVYGDLGIEASNKGPPPEFSVNALVAETETAWALATKDERSPPRIDYLNLSLVDDANAYATIYETFPTQAVSVDRNLRVVRLYDNTVLFEAAPGPAKIFLRLDLRRTLHSVWQLDAAMALFSMRLAPVRHDRIGHDVLDRVAHPKERYRTARLGSCAGWLLARSPALFSRTASILSLTA